MRNKELRTITQVLHDLRVTLVSQFLIPKKNMGRIKIRAGSVRKFSDTVYITCIVTPI